MSLPVRLQSADGVKVQLDVIHIYDVMDGIIIGDFSEHRAKDSVVRESNRLFGRDCKIIGSMQPIICFAWLVSYEHSDGDADGSQMLVGIPMTPAQFLTPFLSIDDVVMKIQWKDQCDPFFI